MLIRGMLHSRSPMLGGLALFVLAASAGISVLLLHRRTPREMLMLRAAALFAGVALTVFALPRSAIALFFLGTAVAGVGFGTGFQGAVLMALAGASLAGAPEVAQALDSIRRETSRAALRQIMARAQASGLLIGHPAELAEQFGGLLWGNLMVSLLLGVAKRPNSREVAARARDATAEFLQLHPLPSNATMPREHR
jgi:hypothetical protein